MSGAPEAIDRAALARAWREGVRSVPIGPLQTVEREVRELATAIGAAMAWANDLAHHGSAPAEVRAAAASLRVSLLEAAGPMRDACTEAVPGAGALRSVARSVVASSVVERLGIVDRLRAAAAEVCRCGHRCIEHHEGVKACAACACIKFVPALKGGAA